MAKTMQWYLDKYGESHLNATNKLIHWVCVPAIVFSLLGLIYAIPFPVARGFFANWAAVFIAITIVYYLRMSLVMAVGMIIVTSAMLWGLNAIYYGTGESATQLAQVCLAIFVIAWIGQFIGHKIEGKKPSFLEDLQFLMIGPAWLLHFIYRKLGIRY